MCWSASVRALVVGGEHDPQLVMIKLFEAMGDLERLGVGELILELGAHREPSSNCDARPGWRANSVI